MSTKTPTDSQKTIVTVGLFRRLFAIAYDAFLVIALLFLSTGIVTLLNGGEAIESGHALYPTLVVSLFLIVYGYFTWFWIRGGQTLGMRTWRIRLISTNGESLDWPRASIRLFVALVSWSIVGLGFLWSLFDKNNQTWHDLASQTTLIDLREQS